MFKKITIIFLLLAISLSITACTSGTAKGETKELFNIDESYNMAVPILFDKEKPIVSFISPDGSVIEGSSLRSDSGDDWVQYYIPNALPGTWKIIYDKLSNTQFDVSYSSYMDSITITELTFVKVNEDHLTTSFTVTSLSEDDFNYKIYAVVTDEEGYETDERLLMEGLTNMNKEALIDVYIGDLEDYNDYKLRLNVWQKKGVEETFDYKISNESFAIKGH